MTSTPDPVVAAAALTALRLAPEALFVLGTDGRMRFMNDSAGAWLKQLFGREVALGDDILDYAGSARAPMAANLARAAAGETVTSLREVTYPGKTTVLWRVAYVPVREGDAVTGVLVAGSDLSVRQGAPAAPEPVRSGELHAEDFLSAFFDAVPTGMMLIGLDGKVLLVNHRAAEILGTTVDGLLYRDIDFLFPRVHAEFEPKQRRVLSIQNLRGETVRLGYTSSVFSQNGEPKGVVVVFQDITELEHLRVEVRQTKRLAALGNFVAKISHDLRNPLFGIQSVMQVLDQGREPDEAELFGAVKAEVKRMLVMLDDLLAFGSHRKAPMETLDLAAVVRGAADSVKYAVKRATELRVAAAEPVRVVGNASLLHRSCVNLIHNAMRATEAGGTVCVAVAVEGDEAVVRIADTGTGIAPDDMRHVFEPFFSTAPDGTGLGLPIAKRAVEDHGGSLEVESQPGQGTTVTIRIPRAAP